MALYTPNEALLFAKTMVKSMPLTDTTVSYQILDYVSAIMWMAAPWSWTLGVLTPTALVAGQIDYVVTIPADFAYLEYAYLTDGKTENVLHVDPYLPAATNAGLVTKVASTATGVRVHPKPPASYTPTLFTLYKKTPPKISAANYTVAGVHGVPDQWAWVYQLGVLWLAYHYADDPRAGVATVGADGRVQYTGFLGAFQDGLNVMRRSEKLPLLLGGEKEQG
jgi:hypothetical protein